VAPADIRVLIVGTESPIDKSKPVASHVQGLLGIGPHCRTYDVTHACIGATYGVLAALDWLRCNETGYALVIASDIAWYEMASPGEPTQGAGAVAMLLSRSPRLLALEEQSHFSLSVYDFWKPMDLPHPLVKGHYSTQCYMLALEACLKGVQIAPEAAFLYHVPFPKIVTHAHETLMRAVLPEHDFLKHFEEHVRPWLGYNRRIGNIYTGSLWLSLACLLAVAEPTPAKRFDGCHMFSYGAGCAATLLRGRFTQTPQELLQHLRLGPMLDNRIQLTFAEYEAIRTGALAGKTDDWMRFQYKGTEAHERCY
jgi:hydroxymethylglutaryl-CoA synthase